jgi:acetoin utilization deacetylase AcuC-like enzyme
LKGDKLGRLNLTMDGLWSRDVMVIEFAKKMGNIPMVSMMGGGYFNEPNHSCEFVSQAHAQTIHLMRNYS